MRHQYVRVEVRGTHREIGRAVGEAAREQIRRAVEYYRSGFPALAGIEFAEAERQVVDFVDCARRTVPLIVAEMEGTAEGSGTTLGEVAVLTCGEEFTCRTDPAQHTVRPWPRWPAGTPWSVTTRTGSPATSTPTCWSTPRCPTARGSWR